MSLKQQKNFSYFLFNKKSNIKNEKLNQKKKCLNFKANTRNNNDLM